MLSFPSKIINIIKVLVIISAFITVIITGIILWKRNKNRKGLFACEYYANADISDLTDEELKELNEEKEMMIWYKNEGKSVVAERSIRTLMNKIYRCMTSVSKNVYIDKLDDIVDEYNNTYNRTFKMKPVDVKDDTYISYWERS